MSTFIGMVTSGQNTGISGYNIVRVGLNMQNALSGLGWIRELTPDQTVWSVNIPQVASGLMPTGAANYQLWRMTDSLTGTFPVVLKWGMGVNSNNLITHEFQAGTGINSNDNLLGATVKFVLTNATTPDSANGGSLSHYAGDSGRFSCALNSDTAANVGRFFAIDRSFNSNGIETAEYITLYGTANNLSFQQTLSSGGNAAAFISHRLMSLLNSSITTASTFDGNVYMSPVFPLVGYIGNPSKNIGLTKSASMTNANTFVGNIYNADRTYMGFNGNAPFLSADGDSSNRTTTIFMRWE